MSQPDGNVTAPLGRQPWPYRGHSQGAQGGRGVGLDAEGAGLGGFACGLELEGWARVRVGEVLAQRLVVAFFIAPYSYV